ncbi:NAD(P)-dependent oxidoreductase [Mesorhizobium sp. STM 4661]|uniref:NAD(P)-dependent oxidoreductase n=1 Tax=Mesorhizobium sp. STM 4661 TaxID=1297570 RepID=UPI0002BD3336|nr:NAD(P)-dependent oxidoreductase [Mesorhizobium sp. STM 4661]CCV12244.1 putative Phosphoglycerate dehydrogenase [Mesorhizobium sp. STM 4661]
MSEQRSAIIVNSYFDGIWPFAAEYWKALWERTGAVEFVRIGGAEPVPIPKSSGSLRRLALLGVDLDLAGLAALPRLEEIGLGESELGEAVRAEAERRSIRIYRSTSEGYWGQSVAEFALGLSLAALRRIPQTHRQILSDLAPWDYSPPASGAGHGQRGSQFGDDPQFANGTIAGKRVRIVGAGNIGSRFASFCRMLGADVASWDPFAQEPGFHRAGARREWHLAELVRDAEIFAPMLPLTDTTRGLVTAALIDALPRGCLVVLVTRATICDMAAVRRRVLEGELALAADVFDVEPLALDDPLLGRDNVVHTPHNAGRTIHANEQFVQNIAGQFPPLAR